MMRRFPLGVVQAGRALRGDPSGRRSTRTRPAELSPRRRAPGAPSKRAPPFGARLQTRIACV